jgi:type IV fimbrial biogenesis protein FimT
VCKLQGLTLLETIIIIAIISILMAGSYPYIQNFLYHQQANATANKILNVFNTATSYASYTNHYLIYCASNDLVHCSDDWQEGYILFVDRNNNLALDKYEAILIKQNALEHAHSLTLRASAALNYLQFNPDGNLHSLGNFIYCHVSGNMQFSKKIVFNRAGRARLDDDDPIQC